MGISEGPKYGTCRNLVTIIVEINNWFVLTPMNGNYCGLSQVRSIYYVLSSLSKNDIEVQRKGLVEIFYKVECPKTDLHLMQNLQQLRDVFPLRNAATHGCSDSPTLAALLKFLRPWMSQLQRSRTRFHCGEYTRQCTNMGY